MVRYLIGEVNIKGSHMAATKRFDNGLFTASKVNRIC